MQKKSGSNQVKHRIKNRKICLGKREKQRLIQLAVCIGIFLVVLAGKGSIPKNSLQYIQTNTDFKSVFYMFGESISNNETILETLRELLKNEQKDLEQGFANESDTSKNLLDSSDFRDYVQINTKRPTVESMLKMVGAKKIRGEPVDVFFTKEAVFAPGMSNYLEPTFSADTAMQCSKLGINDICIPVLGEISSEFGYRIHPIDEVSTFHSGVDIAAEIGTPIKAFAAGKVEYVGESDIYGLYLQIDHGNGVKTFYCHCNELFVQKGTLILKGQVIATVGESGNTTGPHLHLELKQDGVLLNPQYYF